MILSHVFDSEKWQNAADFKQKTSKETDVMRSMLSVSFEVVPLQGMVGMQGMVGIAYVEFSDIINTNVKNCFGQKNKEPALYWK